MHLTDEKTETQKASVTFPTLLVTKPELKLSESIYLFSNFFKKKLYTVKKKELDSSR